MSNKKIDQKMSVDEKIEIYEKNLMDEISKIKKNISIIEDEKTHNGFFYLNGDRINVFVQRENIREIILNLISQIIKDKFIFDLKIKEFGELLNNDEKDFKIICDKSVSLSYDDAISTLKIALQISKLKSNLSFYEEKLKELTENYSSGKIKERKVSSIIGEIEHCINNGYSEK